MKIWTWRIELKELQISLPSFNSEENMDYFFNEYMEDKTGWVTHNMDLLRNNLVRFNIF